MSSTSYVQNRPKPLIFRDAKSLRKYLLRQLKKGRSLHSIQREDFHAAKVGTLSRVKNDPAYEPSHSELRAVLHMTDACPHCHRRVRLPRAVRELDAIDRWWRGLKAEQRRELKEFCYHYKEWRTK